MKKVASQIAVAIVCALLGFMLAYQFKLLSNEEKNFEIDSSSMSGVEITAEIERLKKQKEEIEKKNNELSAQLNKYEKAATGQNDITKEIKNQLDESRILLGTTDVEGPGIIIYLTPNISAFSSNTGGVYVTEEDLVYIINELNFAGAEAISVNDLRITSQSGLKSADNNILINGEKVSPKERITIKAIGDKVKMHSALSFPGALDFKNLSGYIIEYKKQDSIKIPKFNKQYKADYIKPVNK